MDVARRSIRRLSGPAPLALAIGLALPAADAAAQQCWPSSVFIVLRDEAGTVLHPDSVEVTDRPQPSPRSSP